MRYGSVCSGIEAASVAWEPLGWRSAWFAEIDKFPSAVLAHRYPGVKNYGDFTTINGDANPIDVLVGGTPCQAFSIAGLRNGLGDPRGQLTLEFAKLAKRLRPKWIVWENVPGVLSIDGGRAFSSFLGALAELGYGFAYRVLDAQYFRVPQRRRRVFVVGCLGDWRSAAAVLFEPESLHGNPAKSGKARKDIAPTISAHTKGGGGLGTGFDIDGGLIASTLKSNSGGGGFGSDPSETFIPVAPVVYAESETFITHALTANGFDASEDGTGRGTPLVPIAIPILEAGARTGKSTTDIRAGIGIGEDGDPMFTLQSSKQHGIGTQYGVRRLTPRECERLQGFPDDYTRIPYRCGIAADGPRYKALGNSMAVPVMRWIGERLQAVEAGHMRLAA